MDQILTLFFAAGLSVWAQPALEQGALPDRWPTGGPNYEKPFLYLIFGANQAMLWNTGSRNSRVRESVGRTGILLTGDSVYPGRLYVTDFAAFRSSIHRLADFASSRPIGHVPGNHMEQTRTPFVQSMDRPAKVFLRDMSIDPRIR